MTQRPKSDRIMTDTPSAERKIFLLEIGFICQHLAATGWLGHLQNSGIVGLMREITGSTPVRT